MLNPIPQYIPHSEMAALVYDDFFDPETIKTIEQMLSSKIDINDDTLADVISGVYGLVGKLNHENWELNISSSDTLRYNTMSLYSNTDMNWIRQPLSNPSSPNISNKLTALLILGGSEKASFVEIDATEPQHIPTKQGRLIVFPSIVKHKMFTTNKSDIVNYVHVNFFGPKLK